MIFRPEEKRRPALAEGTIDILPDNPGFPGPSDDGNRSFLLDPLWTFFYTFSSSNDPDCRRLKKRFEAVFTNYLIHILIHHGYTLLFLGVMVEQLGLPLPAELLLFAAGAVAGGGQLNLALLFILAVIACLWGDLVWYLIGRNKGRSVLPFLCRISLNPDSCVRLTRNVFSRHVTKTLLVAKFFPGVNTIAPPLSGIMHMKVIRFIILDGLGSCLWVSTFIGLGYLLSNQLEEMVAYASRIGILLWGVIIAGMTVYFGGKIAKRQRFLRQLRMARITPEELKQKLDASENLLIFDVRDSQEFEAEPRVIPGALYCPLERFLKDPPDVPDGLEVILYCD